MTSSQTSQPQPIALTPSCITTHPTTLHVTAHEWNIRSPKLTICQQNDSEPLFKTYGNKKSKRVLTDSFGKPLLIVKRRVLSRDGAWIIRLPSNGEVMMNGVENLREGSESVDEMRSDRRGEKAKGEVEVGRVKYWYAANQRKFDVYFRNFGGGSTAVMDGENVEKAIDQEIVLEVRGQDIRHIFTEVSCKGRTVMTARRLLDSDRELGDGRRKMMGFYDKASPQWILEVSEGVDLSLAAFIAMILADNFRRHRLGMR